MAAVRDEYGAKLLEKTKTLGLELCSIQQAGTITGMPAERFTPWRPGLRPRWHCFAFAGLVDGGGPCDRPGCCRLRLRR